MIHADQVRLILLEELVKSQTRNPHYSMRSFAQNLGISQSAVSEMLAGKRPITRKSAKRILEGLNKSPAEISQMLGSFDDSTPKFQTLDIDVFHMIADWHYYAILSLAETIDFESSPQWIARRLGISDKLASEAIERLLRLDLLKRNKKTGKLQTSGEHLEAFSVVANPALKKANRQNLELAANALDQIPVESRDFTAITLCFDPDRMDDARKLIKNFRRSFNRVMEAGRKKEVYKLCVQLFPLTRSDLK